MQGLLDPPRQGFTRQNLLDVLGWCPIVGYDAGYELLDSQDNAVADLSEYLVKPGSKVMRDCNADVHGSCVLNTEYPHNWGVDRVKIYYLMFCDSVPLGPVRFDLGVYCLTTPGQPLGTGTPVYPSTGYDKLYLLNQPIGDAYSVASGAVVLSTVRTIITTVTGSSHIILDGTKSTSTLADAKAWSVTDAQTTTWLQVVNALLSTVSYRPLWADQNGYYRSEPYVDPATRPTEFTVGAGDSSVARFVDPRWAEHVIVSNENRSLNRTAWNQPNWWRFVQSGLTFQPIEGSGQYTVQNISAGPTSQAAAGRIIKAPVQALSATGQADLQAQGDRVVAQAIATAESVTFSTAPLPIAGHYDVLMYADPTLPGADNRRVVAQQWSLPLDGKDMDWVANVAQPVDGNLWSGSATPPVRPANIDPPPHLGQTYITPARKPVGS